MPLFLSFSGMLFKNEVIGGIITKYMCNEKCFPPVPSGPEAE